MHMTIAALVYAADPDGARSLADTIFAGLCGEGLSFDYYTILEKGGVQNAVRADSRDGRKLVQSFWRATVRDFKDSMAKIRYSLGQHTDKEIMEGAANGVGLVRYNMHLAGSYSGSSIWLYNNDGAGIRSQHDLLYALTNGASAAIERGETDPGGLPDGQYVWVVQADVHF